MKQIKVESILTVYGDLTEAPKQVQDLMKVAQAAREKAYAPYSQFSVGAALLLDTNEIVSGNNQENASYPSGLCAERTAIYSAAANYPNSRIMMLAITAGSTKHNTDKPIPPCGACRQAIAEYEIKQEQPIVIYFMGESGKLAKSNSLSNLLPWVFDKNVL